MRPVKHHFLLFTTAFLIGGISASAQLPGAQPDPLARIREAAKTNVQACSATGETLCEQVAPKIIANAQGESPLAENLRHLHDDIFARVSGKEAAARAAEWGVAAFHEAGLDVHTEKYANRSEGAPESENIVAEIRGREKPDEWVLVAAPLDTHPHSENSCDAAALVEAARDIQITGIRPRRSIRFVLFTGYEEEVPGSWAYVRSHRMELDRARAAIIFNSRCDRVTGYELFGRRDIEVGVREAMKPIESFGAGQFLLDAMMGSGFDFVIEGVPTLTAIHITVLSAHTSDTDVATPDKIDIANLKRNTAIVAVTAFGIAERAEPIGPRQSRSEIEPLLKSTGLEQLMKNSGLWPLWESGERGRLP
jgi:Zn-dependent M28 family amino/carboxypeptidase